MTKNTWWVKTRGEDATGNVTSALKDAFLKASPPQIHFLSCIHRINTFDYESDKQA